MRGNTPDITLRPLQPPIVRTLALIEHRNKPNEPALEIVREALLGLRLDAPASARPARKGTGHGGRKVARDRRPAR